MKKLFCLLLVGGLLVSFASCKKTCTCEVWIDGVKTTNSNYTLPSEYKKCSDVNTIVESEYYGKTGIKCK
jgi:hypothetical protein